MCDRTVACPACRTALSDLHELTCMVAYGAYSTSWVCPGCGSLVRLTSEPPAPGRDRNDSGIGI